MVERKDESKRVEGLEGQTAIQEAKSLSRHIDFEQNPPSGERRKDNSLTQSYNSRHSLSLRGPQKKILELIDSGDFSLTPKEIAFKTGINDNTVRVYLRRLLRDNFVIQPSRGHYTSRKSLITFDGCTGGAITGAPRVHNVRLKVVGLRCGKVVRCLRFGVVSVSVVVGEGGVGNVQVDCDKGVSLDYVGFKVLLACLFRELRIPESAQVLVTSFELNHDYAGIRIDGCQALTLRAFDGSFERVYNKRKNLLRSEVKSVGSTTPEAVYQLLKGGVNTYNIMQGLFLLVNEVRQEREAQKFTNRVLYELLQKIAGKGLGDAFHG